MMGRKACRESKDSTVQSVQPGHLDLPDLPDLMDPPALPGLLV